MSLRISQKASRKANRTGRDPVRRAAQTAAQTIENSSGVISRWETLENRLMMSINQIDPTNLVFEGEDTQATITDGTGRDPLASTTWARLTGAGIQGDASSPSGGSALVAINQNADVAVRTTATVSYPLNFTTPGVYRLYIRGKYTGGGDNSFFVPPHKADGTSPISGNPADTADNGNPFDNHNADTARAGNYNWFGSDSGDVPVLYTVGAAGPTSLTFMIRETSYMIDKVVLSTNQTLTNAQLDAAAGIGAQPAAGSVTAHYYNDTFQGMGGAPAAPSTARSFPDETITIARAGDVVKSVPNIAFDWGTGSPDPAIRADNFSTLFVGKVTAPETGEYDIRGFGDDDTHIFVNGQLVSSNPGGHGIEDPTVQGSIDRGGGTVKIALTAGQSYDFVALQTEGGGGAGIQMKWVTPSMRTQLGDLAPLINVPSQYLSPAEPVPAAPSGAARSDTLPDGNPANANQVAITFTDNATNELHYELQSSSDGGVTWRRRSAAISRIVSNENGAPATETLVGGAPVPGKTEQYRVVAWNLAGESASNVISVTSPAAVDAPGATGYYFNDRFWNGYNGGDPSRSVAANDILVGRNADEFQETANVNFDWGTSSPDPATIRLDNHSTVWQGKIHFDEAGVYTVASFGDDDTYLFIGNELASAHPGGHGVPGTLAGIPVINPINIPAAGDYDFTAVQAEQGGGSGIHLRWVPPSAAGSEAVDIPDANYVSNQPSIPAAPTGFTVTSADPNQASITFTDVSVSELRYVLERATESAPGSGVPGAFTSTRLLPIVHNDGVAGDPTAPANVSFLDTGLTPNTKYFYRLTAENFRAASTPANATVTTAAAALTPAAPTNLTHIVLGNNVRLGFNDNSTNETGFILERRPAAGGAFTAVPGSPFAGSPAGQTGPFVITLPNDPAQSYVYRVRATNPLAVPTDSANSNESVPLSQGLIETIWGTMTFTEDPNDPGLVKVAPNVDENFDANTGGGPDPTIDGETFSIIYEGAFTAPATGDYTFYGGADDGIRVIVAGTTVVDALVDQGYTVKASDTPMHLEAGQKVAFRTEYYENGGGARVTVEYSATDADGNEVVPRAIIPTTQLSPQDAAVAPFAPSGVTATVIGNCVYLTFTDNSTTETSFVVERGTSADGPFTAVGSPLAGNNTTRKNISTRIVDGTATGAGPYYYRVRAINGAGGTSSAVTPDGVTPGTAGTGVNFTDFSSPATQSQWTLVSKPDGTASASFIDFDGDPDGTTERLQLTDNLNDQWSAAYLTQGQMVNGFTASFDTQVTESNGADGFAFVLQSASNGLAALGGGGGALGLQGIPYSIGLKYDFYPGLNQTGLYLNGDPISDVATDPRNRVLPATFDLDGTIAAGESTSNGIVLRTTLSYDPTTKVLTQTIDDIDNPATAPFTTTYNVDIPAALGGGDCAFVGFTGGTGGLNAQQDVLNFKFTPGGVTPPQAAKVTQVFVNGQGITGQTTANGIAFRNLAGVDNTFGYPVPGPNQLKSIPWSNGINKISLRFDKEMAATLDQSDLVVRGINTANYAISAFTYDAATKTGTWTLTTPITNDKVNLFLDDANVGGLDGEWTTAQAYPSGNGTAGGDFTFRLNVQRGDANQDGSVNALDLGQLKSKLNRTATNPGTGTSAYSPFADLNADGQINALDLGIAKARLNNRLPNGEPASLFSSLPVTR